MVLLVSQNKMRVIVSTYQSITGTGVKAVQHQTNDVAIWHINVIHRNAIPQCDSFEDNG
jgi:aspartate-semialdehyde dehydrogenase